MGSKLRSSTAGMSHHKRVGFLRSVISHMTGNANFPEPWALGLSLAILIAVADKYDGWIISAERGDRDNIATRNEVAVEVQNALDKLAHYVEMVAGDNLAALRSSGFPLRKKRGKTTATSMQTTTGQTVTVENLPESRKVRLHASSTPGTISREVQITTGDPAIDANWLHKAVFPPGADMEIECDAGATTFFRFRDITEQGLGPWSQPVSTFVT